MIKTKRLKFLSTQSESLFKKLNKDTRIEKHKQILSKYVEDLGGVLREKDLNVQFSNFKTLYVQTWTPLRSGLWNELRNEKEIIKLIEEIEECCQLLLREMGEEIRLSSLAA